MTLDVGVGEGVDEALGEVDECILAYFNDGGKADKRRSDKKQRRSTGEKLQFFKTLLKDYSTVIIRR